MSQSHEFQDIPTEVTIMVDSDWAGDIVTRRSTSGGFIFHGSHILCHWSKTQSTIALSSGEGEVNACVKGISEGIGVHELMTELGMSVSLNLELLTDSSAAKGTITRHGSGRIKHLTIKQLWIQEALKDYEVAVTKIPRRITSADLLAHPCNSIDFDWNLQRWHSLRN